MSEILTNTGSKLWSTDDYNELWLNVFEELTGTGGKSNIRLIDEAIGKINSSLDGYYFLYENDRLYICKDNTESGTTSKSKLPVSLIQSDGKVASSVDGTTITIDENGVLHGATDITVDDVLSLTSTNPVQNKVITGALNGKANSSHTHLSSDVTDLIDVIYPVGSIYMSVGNTSPSTLFGGTWEQIEDKFLLACGTKHQNGDTGGSEDAVVVTHTHSTTEKYLLTTSGGAITRNSTAGTTGTKVSNLLKSDDGVARNTIEDTGTSGVGKNMPPYLAVNVWKRIA